MVPHSSQLTHFQAREYGDEINDLLVHARYLVNSFHVTVRIPPEILNMICSHLTTEDDIFSASQVCRHWRGVLISSPPLWTRLPCYRVSRTIASLERCKSMPIQLEFDQQSSNVALESVILYTSKVSSLAIYLRLHTVPLLHQLLTFAMRSMERLFIYFTPVWGVEEQVAHQIWPDMPSLRKLFISRYPIPIVQLSAPNLAHLAMELTEYQQNATIQSLLDILCACPLLETLLIAESRAREDPDRDHSPVPLPYLRSIELGMYEVCSGLITHLLFPSTVAVGFRALSLTDVLGDAPPAVMAAIHHVLGRVDIDCVTFAVPLLDRGDSKLFVRFEGLQSSLELTIHDSHTDIWPWDVLDPRGVLFSNSSHIGSVRELRFTGCSFRGSRGVDHINASMPNLNSISFFHCDGHFSALLTPTNLPSPPFPRLERVMAFGPESELMEMVEARRDHGVPLKTLVLGRLPGGLEDCTDTGEFDYDNLEDYTELEEFVEDLRVRRPVKIFKWGNENEILNIWSTAKSGPVCPTGSLQC